MTAVRGGPARPIATLAFAACAVVAAVVAPPSHAARVMPVELRVSDDLVLSGWWTPAAAPGRRPAFVLMHGCAGLMNRDGLRSAARYDVMRERLLAEGWHVLMLDSFGGRRIEEICTVREADRRIRPEDRVADARAALAWLRTRPEVDPDRLVLLGWSHGGRAILELIDAKRNAEPLPGVVRAIAYYPGCSAARDRGFVPKVATRVFIGELDDWTPAAPCIAIGERLAGHTPSFRVDVLRGAHHDFDNPNARLRVRTDVPGGLHPGRGVTVGGDPKSRDAAYAAMFKELREALR